MKTLEWLARLVACDTTSRNSNLQLIDLIKDWMFHHQIPIRMTHSPYEQKSNLLATIPAKNGDMEGGIILSGHTDVVPVDNQSWDTNPFEIVQKEGKVYGRGTADMKGFLAVILALVPEFKRQSLSRPIHLAFSYDEEIGCKGAPLLIRDIEQAALKPYACIVGEPTMMQSIVAHKGIQVFRCRVHGQTVHSSLTTQGCNAIEHAAKFINYLRNLADQFKKDGPFDSHYDVPFTSVSTNMINGGIAVNTIPAVCEFMFEFRHLPQVSAKAIREQIENYIQQELLPNIQNEFAQGSIEFEHMASVPAFETDMQSAVTKQLLTLSNQKEINKVAYATEAGLFEKAQIPTIICGPGSIEQAHRANEFVSLDQLALCEKFLLRMVNQI